MVFMMSALKSVMFLSRTFRKVISDDNQRFSARVIYDVCVCVLADSCQSTSCLLEPQQLQTKGEQRLWKTSLKPFCFRPCSDLALHYVPEKSNQNLSYVLRVLFQTHTVSILPLSSSGSSSGLVLEILKLSVF